MISAWILLASSAIFFAAWMKPVLPNGEWFQVHRAFMIVSLFIGAAGFIFAFIANAKSEIPGFIGTLEVMYVLATASYYDNLFRVRTSLILYLE